MTEGCVKMRRVILSLIILGFYGVVTAAEFGYPAAGEPWYSIRVRFADASTLTKGSWRVTRVSVNGARVRDFLLYQEAAEVLGSEVQGGRPFELRARFAWQGSRDYEIQVQLENARSKKPASLSQKVQSPALKGYWNPDWKNYLSLIVSEENGYDRPIYPVHASLGILSSYFRSGDEIRVVRADLTGGDVAYTEIPSQVYDVVTWDDKKAMEVVEKDEKTGERITRYHPTTTFGLAFPASLKAHEKATYLVFFNNPAAPRPAYASDLKVTGQGLGKTIENSFYKVTLNKKSGVIYEITEKESRTRLEHKLETNGSVHWNPGVYSPPHAWYHTSDWENPSFVEVSGPVVDMVRIAAPLPHYPNVLASITYHFYAGVPYILVETTIDITDNLFVQALRNGEIVFNKKVFNRAGYKTMAGEVRTIDLTRTRMHPEHVVTLRPDVPWVTFYNDATGVAFANLYVDLTMTNLEGGEASATQPFVYIQNGPWYYLARGLVYSFGTNNQTRMLPVRRGSVYYERNAFYPFVFKKDQGYAARVDRTYDSLKHPASVMESIETFLESPEGWVVPILTEPFEEGVAGAVGKQKK
jgi:hypothetical protein